MHTRSQSRGSPAASTPPPPAAKQTVLTFRKRKPGSARAKKGPRPLPSPLPPHTCTPSNCTVARCLHTPGSPPPVLATSTRTPSPPGAALAFLRRADARLCALIDEHGAPALPARRDAFDSLVVAACNQRVSVAAGATVLARLRALVGAPPGAPLRPCDVSGRGPAELRVAGLGEAKAACIVAVGRAWCRGEVGHGGLEGLADEEVVRVVSGFKGFGEWSAQMMMMGSLAREDVLPVGDLALVRGAERMFGRRLGKGELERACERFRPYRTFASWYFWANSKASKS